jgi:FtsZ-binding cell division protein ZapB
MKKVININTVELTRDALYKAFWTKKALKRFLAKQGITEIQLLPLFTDGNTKSQYINNYLFARLVKDDIGLGIIEKMAMDLASFTAFPDLSICDDVKERTSSAIEAVKLLKRDVDKLIKERNEEISSAERQKLAKELEAEISKGKNNFKELKNRLNELIKDLGKQQAGYDFEDWIYDLCSYSDIQTKRPYKEPDGRQIDGSVTLEGFTFLLESKFTIEPIGVDAIDSFRVKVEKMSDNTMGIMISMSGFTDGAKKGASGKKTPLLLLDGYHLYNLILTERMNLIDCIGKIKRHASHTADAYLSVQDFDK